MASGTVINTTVDGGGIVNSNATAVSNIVSTISQGTNIVSTITGGGIGPRGLPSTQITVSNTAPSSPALNDLWIDTSS